MSDSSRRDFLKATAGVAAGTALGGTALWTPDAAAQSYKVTPEKGATLRVLLSDASAATDWTLARSAVDHIGVHVDVDDEQAPVGDLAILADLGVSADEMAALLDDYDLLTDETLSEIADGAGFGPKFDDLVGISE